MVLLACQRGSMTFTKQSGMVSWGHFETSAADPGLFCWGVGGGILLLIFTFTLQAPPPPNAHFLLGWGGGGGGGGPFPRVLTFSMVGHVSPPPPPPPNNYSFYFVKTWKLFHLFHLPGLKFRCFLSFIQNERMLTVTWFKGILVVV